MPKLHAGIALTLSLLSAAVAPAVQAESRLHLECRGDGQGPTVVLEAGAFGTSADWDLVQNALASDGRVCAYDRAGLGRSPAHPGGRRDASAIAADLRATLDAASEVNPVILVGHSNGALFVQTFAALWPDRVAGLVYVDGVHDGVLDRPGLLREVRRERTWARLTPPASVIGLTRLFAPSAVSAIGLFGNAASEKGRTFATLRHARTARAEAGQIEGGLRRVRELARPPSTIPVAVVVAGSPATEQGRAWRAVQVAAIGAARRSWVIDAPAARHVDPLGRYRSYTVAAVNWIRSEARRAAGASVGVSMQ